MKSALLLLLVVSCKDDPAPAPAPVATAAVASDAGIVAIDARIDAGLAIAVKCSEPCLFLDDTPLDKLAETYQQACGKPTELGLNDCKKLDYARNCIYAAHGQVFKRKWRAFAKQPWFQASADGKPSALSEVATGNVRELRARGKACKKGIHVSAADLALATAWVAAFRKGKAAVPKYTVADHDLVKSTKTWLPNETFADRLADKLELEYVEPTTLVAADKLAAAFGAAKLRAIAVTVPAQVEADAGTTCTEDSCEVGYIYLVYDDKAYLVARFADGF